MNERIRELAKEAGFEIDNGPLLPGLTTITMQVGGLYVGVPVEKFAELIVKEVFNRISEERFEVYEPVVQSVKQYFGVKYE